MAKFYEQNTPLLPLNDELFFYDVEAYKVHPQSQKNVLATELDNFAAINISIAVGYSQKFGYCFFGAKELHQLFNIATKHKQIVGFQSQDFADLVLGAKGIQIKTDYDLLREVRIAAGQSPNYIQKTDTYGYGLNSLASANLTFGFNDDNLIAPYLYRQGMEGQLITHCLTKVKIMIALYLTKHKLIDPTNGKRLKCRALIWDDPHPVW